MQVLTTDVAIVGGGAAGCICRAHPASGRGRERHHLQGTCRQERSVDLRRQPGSVRPRARQYRGAGAQYGRVPHQVPQPVPDRSALGAAVWSVDRERLLSRARGGRPLPAARRAGQHGHQPGKDPQRGGQCARKFRRAVHGSAPQADHQGCNSAPGRDRGHGAAAQTRRFDRRRARARHSDGRVRRGARAGRDSGDRIFRSPACPLDRHARDVGRRPRDGLARRGHAW